MNIAPIIFFDMMVSILVLAITLIIIVLRFSKTSKSSSISTQEKYGSLEEDINLLDTARLKAIKTIDSANNKALDIVSGVTLSINATSDKFKEDLLRTYSNQIKEFEKVTSDFTKVYSQTLQDLKTKNVEIFQNISKDIENTATEELNNFKESVERLTVKSQQEVKGKIDIDYEALRKKLEDYEKESFLKIDVKAYELLERVSKLVLGKAINLSDHEDLIEKSLEKAKKEGVFE